MFKINTKKSLFIKAFILCLIIISTIYCVHLIIERARSNADAASGNVVVYQGGVISYGDWGTHYYNVLSGGVWYTAYCANPSLTGPSGTLPSYTMNQSNVKLMTYIGSIDTAATEGAWRDFLGYVPSEYEAYLWTHIVIGYIYAGDTYGVPSSWYSTILSIANKLQNYINNNATVWQEASQYELNGINLSAAGLSPYVYQNIVWVEGSPSYGSIEVQKYDKETETRSPQGNGSLSGIKFEVYDQSGSTLKYRGETDGNGVVTFTNIPVGSYLVKEVASNSTYQLTATSSQSATITKNGQTRILKFYDYIKKGKITINKRDKELGTCDKLGSASFEGNKFSITNKSSKPVYYNGSVVAVNSVVATKTMGASDCAVVFNDLPYGTYEIHETATNAGYLLNGTVETVTIPTGSSDNITKTYSNQVIRGDVKFVKKDTVAQSPMANVAFRIKSNTTNESHIVVTNANGVVNTANSHIPHDQRTNCYDSTFQAGQGVTDQTCGTWFGNTTVDNSLGALPYDTYTIEELACTANQHCSDTGRQKTFTVSTNNTVVDLEDWNNTCNYTISTKAYDGTNGNTDQTDKFIEATAGAVVKDEVYYCGAVNTSYKIDGKLINKSNNAVLATSGPISVTTGADGCGTTVMSYNLTATQLADLKGADLVVFEYLKNDITTLAQHEDKNDASQTVTVISLATTATDTHDGDQIIYNAITESNIKDTIDYCLRANEHYIIKGILMDKATNQPLLVNGSEITATKAIDPATPCGTTSMIFDIDVTWLGGTEVVVFETVEHNNRDIISHEDINDEAQTIDIVSLSTLATDDSDGDHIIFDEQEAKIRDAVDYCLIPGKTYTIKSVIMDSKNGLPLKINGEKVETSTEITPTEKCGYIELYFDIDPAEIAGHNIVMFEDLYYNDHLVLEHNTLFDNYETINVLSLSTTATDLEDGDKLMAANKQVTITDKVDYCLLEDETFTIKGVVMNKTTKEILLINGAPVEQTITITPEEKCGSVNMEYTLDTTGLGGNELIIFESLYYDDERILAHEDFNNAPETVSVLVPTPDTGLFTKAEWEDKEEQIAPVISIVAVALPATFLIIGFGARKIHSRRHIKFN